MENQNKNSRFLKNEEFSSTAIEMLQNLGRTIIDTESFYVPDEMRFQFQDSKRELLDAIDKACGKIKFMRNFKSDYEYGEDFA